MQQRKKALSSAEARERIYRYCAFQERCHSEVKTKLLEIGMRGNELEEIISELITQGYLNEERFARAFAGGKFRMKKWGRLKIVHQLESKGLTPNCIRAGLKEIDEDDYHKTLESLISKKFTEVDAENLFIKNDKVADYAIRKGFEPDLVWTILRQGHAPAR